MRVPWLERDRAAFGALRADDCGGPGMTIDDYRSIEALFPVDTTILAFRVALGAAPSLRPVSRMRVATVGQLSELPPIMRRAGS